LLQGVGVVFAIPAATNLDGGGLATFLHNEPLKLYLTIVHGYLVLFPLGSSFGYGHFLPFFPVLLDFCESPHEVSGGGDWL
jgi:Sec-independent protein secretion pathway component TatC